MNILITIYKAVTGGAGGALGGAILALIPGMPHGTAIVLVLTAVGTVFHSVKNLIEQSVALKKEVLPTK